jgi:hypothetical protein
MEYPITDANFSGFRTGPVKNIRLYEDGFNSGHE